MKLFEKKPARLFTFGCSFTNYQWPTWADIIIHDLSIEGYNYGLSGIGNVGIMYRILEADIRHKFTPDDCILINWTSWSREDRFIDGEWKRYGNVYNNPYYQKKFWKYCSPENDLIKNSNSIILINKLYKDKIKFQSSVYPILENEVFIDFKETYADNYAELKEFYLSEINFVEENFWKTYNKFQCYTIMDGHPTVKCHLSYVEDVIDHKCKDSTKEYFLDMHQKILKTVNKFGDNFQGRLDFWKPTVLGFS